jgi:tetratricopeptide (TPR) repeat protein
VGLYEREQELKVARAAIDDLCRGFVAGKLELGGLLFFSGDAGLGKTALLTEVRQMAGRREGTTVLFARGSEQHQEVPFYVLRQLLQPLLARMSEDRRRDLFGAWYDIAAPAMGLARPDPAVAPEPQGVQDALVWVITQLAVNLAPLVIIVDDVHWADPLTLTWLSAFSARVRELPVLVVLAFRGNELPQLEGVIDFLTDGRTGKTVNLHELTPDAVTALVRGEFGDRADDAFCKAFWDATAGNPFDTQELLYKVSTRGIPPVASSASQLRQVVASGKGEALKQRLHKLGVTVFRVAWAAGVLGNKIDAGLLADLATTTPAEAATIIDQLREERILTGGQVLEFVHPTIASTIYESTPKRVREAMHGIAYSRLLRAGKSPAELSRHMLEITPEGDLELVRSLRRAAAEHMAMGAPDAARQCLERALMEPPADEDLAVVTYELGCVTQLLDQETTVNHMRNALEMVPGLDSDRRVRAVQRLAQALAHLNRAGEAAHEVYQAAETTPEGSHRLQLRAAYQMWSGLQGDAEHAMERSQRIDELARGCIGRDESERAVLVLRAWDLTLRGGETSEILTDADHGLVAGRLADGLGWTNDFWSFEVPGLLGITYAYNDRLDLAAELFNDAMHEYQRAGWGGSQLALAIALQGLVARRWGQLAEAERLLRDALQRSERVGRGTPAQWDSVGLLIDTLIARGDVKEAIALADAYDFHAPYPTVPVLPHAATLHGRLLHLRGQTRSAIEHLEAAGKDLDTRGQYNTVWAPWAGELAVILRDREPERAKELAALGLKRAERFGTSSAIGCALRHCAAVTVGDESVQLLEQAVEHLGRSPASYEYAEALVDQGAALRRLGKVRDAEEPLYLGHDLADQCKSPGLVARARQELAAIGLRPTPERGVIPEPLSEAERRVAQLAVQNFPTARIAGELGIPVRTTVQLLASAHRKAAGPAGLKAALGWEEKKPDA